MVAFNLARADGRRVFSQYRAEPEVAAVRAAASGSAVIYTGGGTSIGQIFSSGGTLVDNAISIYETPTVDYSAAFVAYPWSSPNVERAEDIAAQLSALEDRLAALQRRMTDHANTTSAVTTDTAPASPTEVTDGVRTFFRSTKGSSADADEVAVKLGLPLWDVIDAMEALEAEGAITLAE